MDLEREPFRTLDLEVDLANDDVRLKGQRLQLTPRALELFRLLVQRPGQLVHYQDIRRALWKDGLHVDFERNIRLHVNKLRKAFQDDPRAPRYIETVPRRGYRFIPRIRRLSRTSRVTVAVLPFDNLGSNPDEDYFTDGMTDELIVRLGRVNPPKLGVIARTTAFLYKKGMHNTRTIGGDLGVDYFVEGTVRRSGDRVRISVNLIEVAGQTQQWSDVFDEQITDVLDLQTRIAKAIATEVRVHIPETVERLSVRPDAFDAFLKGRYLYFSLVEADMSEGIGYLQRAVELDPDFAEAQVFLADTLHTLSLMGALELELVRSRIVGGVERAFRVSPNLAEARSYHAVARGCLLWDWRGVLAQVERAAAQGRNSDTSRWCGYCHLVIGALDDAVTHFRNAADLDPLSATMILMLGWALHRARRYEEARETLMHALTLEHASPVAMLFLSDCYLCLGDSERARTAIDGALARSPKGGHYGYGASILARLGHETAAREALRSLESQSYVDPYYVAAAHGALDEVDAGLDALEQAVSERTASVTLIKIDSFLDPLRGHPRFRALQARVHRS